MSERGLGISDEEWLGCRRMMSPRPPKESELRSIDRFAHKVGWAE